MKSIISLLLGLSLSFADTDTKNEQFSWDSADASTSQSYNGLVIQVYQPDNEALTITLSATDDVDNVYCLNFAKIYEAIFEDNTCRADCTFEIISGTEIDLADANCTVSETSQTQFQAICYDVNEGTLTLDFLFKQDNDGEYGLEYTIELTGYTMSEEENAKFVMEQSVKDCTTEFPDSGDSGENSAENDDDNDDDDEDTTDAPDGEDTTDAPDGDEATTIDPERRRFIDDHDENETTDKGDDNNDDDDDDVDSDSGISSDDSREYDVGLAQFIISGAAKDVCIDNESSNEVEYYMIEREDNNDDEAIQLVFNRFECDLKVDPWFKLDEGKVEDNKNKNLNDDGVYGMNIMSGVMFIGFISLFLF